MREGFVATKNGNIWYCVYGEEKSKTPLLVVHGGPGFVTMPEVIQELSTDRPVYFYDQLGCGKSDRATDANFYSLDNYIEELAEVRNALKLTDVILMGFSWGCGLITAAVLKQGAEGVKGMVLSAPLLSSPMWEKDQRDNIATMPPEIICAIEEGERTQVFGAEYQSAMMAYYNQFVYQASKWPDSLQSAFESLNMDVYLRMWGQSEFTVSGTLKDFDLYPRLSEIEIPVLLTCGDSDEAGVKSVKDFQMKFHNAHMAVIPNAAHLHQIEQPEIYLAVINAFLKGK